VLGLDLNHCLRGVRAFAHSREQLCAELGYALALVALNGPESMEAAHLLARQQNAPTMSKPLQ
jgi:hypothetical protein